MSKYNVYARKLDAAFKEARQSYNETFAALKAAREKYSDKARREPGEPEYTWLARKSEAQAALSKAEEVFYSTGQQAWSGYKKQAESILLELKRVATGNGLVNPDDVDASGVELLKSGVCKIDDIESLVDKYQDNATMLRLIGKYASDMYGNASIEDKERLSVIIYRTTQGIGEKVSEFESIVSASYTYAGLTRDDNSPEFIVSMSQRWEEATQDLIDNF